jgi:non-heme Fe2+,alpha-ketoglutarate-dependent halogenase
MPKYLTENQVSQYHAEGFCSPIDIMPEQEALALAGRLAEAEQVDPEGLQGRSRNNAHLVYQFLDEIAFHPVILDIVEDLLGKDFLLWGTVLFIKEPESPGYVSWHQDATYMGLEPHQFLTPWLALSHSNPVNGCMSMIPGSHRDSIRPHTDTFDEDNLLTRGQNIDGIDESGAVDLVLKPGQASVHHCRTIHGSRPNRSDQRRIGVALQSYITPRVKAIGGTGHSIPCRGSDPFRHHEALTRPTADMSDQGLKQREMVNDNWAEILYRGAEKSRNY